MAKKSGLGKGLDLLIPNNTSIKTDEKMEEKLTEKKAEVFVKLSQVEPNKSQPRKNFNEDSLIELSESIKQFGVIQPLIVQKKDDYYEIIAGERRWRAAKLAGLKEIPVIIREYSDEERMEVALIENLQREDLNPVEEALAYKSLIKEYNLKQDEIAEKVSKSRTAVTNSMRLLNLPEEVQNMIVDEMISSGHGRALLSIEDEKIQINIANKIFEEKLSVRETEKLVKALNNPKEKKEKEEYTDTFIYEKFENDFKEILGSNVSIKRKSKDKGKIEIDYYSNEDLERIMDLIKSIQ
ncbi:MAG: ParB/RepB/Spo0J family partition protein [Lachnospiraceae bacterium]|jgi:ParB-like partition proteins|nr:ParB/RepB/Spo0J family partition protein [Lachnospiraceae bacterium]MCI8825040.1 ParB/RepB/Spo0J family partition protein [Lachnospiraceae bacterium]MCI9369705.1 ParB/RepB/Spo0J family partition protein [Lachnospiraceae bacterium]